MVVGWQIKSREKRDNVEVTGKGGLRRTLVEGEVSAKEPRRGLSTGFHMVEVESIFSAGATAIIDIEREEGESTSYRTVFEGCEEDSLLLQAPLRKGVAIRLPVGEKIRIGREKGNRFFSAQVRVIGHRWSDEVVEWSRVLLIVTEYPEEVTSTKRRGYFRLDVALPVEIDGVEGKVVNLSGNGMLVLIDEQLEDDGQEKEVKLTLPDAELPLLLKAEVVRTEDLSESRQRVGMHFTEILDSNRDQILKYLLKRQRELIKTGLAPRER